MFRSVGNDRASWHLSVVVASQRIAADGLGSIPRGALMTPNVLLLQTPAIDFGTFLTVSRQALGYDVASAVDASPVDRTDAEKFLSCLAAMQDKKAKPGPAAHLLSHVSFSVLIAANDEDMLAILEILEMPFVAVNTSARGVQLAVATGTLARWCEAVKLGSRSKQRAAFNRIMGLFGAVGLNVWKDCETVTMPDGMLLLKDQR